MTIRTLIFDLDGTLIDSMDLVYEAFQTSIEHALGRRPSREEIQHHFGLPEGEIIRRMAGARAAPAAIEEFHRLYESEHSRRVRVFPGITELLHRLDSDGISLGLVTGKGRRSTEYALRAVGIDQCFQVVVTGDDVLHPKPHPEGLLNVIGDRGVFPHEALYLGDAQADMDMGRAAGAEVGVAGWNPETVKIVDDTLIRFMRPEEVLSWLRTTVTSDE